MQKSIHPQWHHDTVVTCTCGNKFTTGSIQETIQVDICSQCHPFFTGEVRFVDRQGRVDKFLQKQKKAQAAKAAKAKKSQKSDDTPKQDPKSYQEILRQQQQAIKTKSKAKAA